MKTHIIPTQATPKERLVLIKRINQALMTSLKRIERIKQISEQEASTDVDARNH